MFDHSAIFDAFGKLDTKACENAVGQDGLDDPIVAGSFLLTLRQSGCLLLKFSNPAREAKRDKFVGWLKKAFSRSKNKAITVAFEAHLNDVSLIERGFRTISTSMEQSAIWKLDAGVQA